MEGSEAVVAVAGERPEDGDTEKPHLHPLPKGEETKNFFPF